MSSYNVLLKTQLEVSWRSGLRSIPKSHRTESLKTSSTFSYQCRARSVPPDLVLKRASTPSCPEASSMGTCSERKVPGKRVSVLPDTIESRPRRPSSCPTNNVSISSSSPEASTCPDSDAVSKTYLRQVRLEKRTFPRYSSSTAIRSLSIRHAPICRGKSWAVRSERGEIGHGSICDTPTPTSKKSTDAATVRRIGRSFRLEARSLGGGAGEICDEEPARSMM